LNEVLSLFILIITHSAIIKAVIEDNPELGEQVMATLLIAGGAGYIGSHVVKMLIEEGYDVVVLDNLSKGHRKAVMETEFIKGDLGDRALLNQIFTSRKVDCVMHFAAFCLVRESVQQPFDYYDNNTAKTNSLLMTMKEHGVNKFIFSSTAAVYGEPRNVPLLETDPTQPINPYGRSKLFIEKILEDCDKAHDIKYISLRYFNAAGADEEGNIGEDHSPETHLIPLILQVALRQREHIEIYGTDWDTPDGTCIRDYIHVTDLAKAHILAAQCLMDGQGSAVYNLGSQTGYSIREIISICRKVTGHPIHAKKVSRQPGDPTRLVASYAKIRSELGWAPRVQDLEKIVATAWNWHKKHINGYGRREQK